MKKWTTAILLFDLVAGLLFLGLWEEKGAVVTAGGSVVAASDQVEMEAGGETSATDGAVREQTEEMKKIALTFDDGPHPFYTEELLDGLKERGVVVTFFVTGEHASLHPDVIKRMQEDA